MKKPKVAKTVSFEYQILQDFFTVVEEMGFDSFSEAVNHAIQDFTNKNISDGLEPCINKDCEARIPVKLDKCPSCDTFQAQSNAEVDDK